MKQFFLTFLIITCTIVGLITAVPAFLRTPWGHTKIEALVSESIGKQLLIETPLSLALGKTLSLKAERVSLRDPSSDLPPLVSVDSFEILVPVFQNYFDGFEVSSIRAKGLHVAIAKSANGRSNWSFASTSSETSENDAHVEISVPSIDSLVLEDSSLEIVRPSQQRHFTLNRIALSGIGNETPITLEADVKTAEHPMSLTASTGPLGQLSRNEPLAFKVAAKSAETNVSLDGTVTRDGDIRVAIDAGTPELQNLAGLFGVELPAWKKISLKGVFTESSRDSIQLGLDKLEITIDEHSLSGFVRADVKTNGTISLTSNLENPSFTLAIEGDYLTKKNGFRAAVKTKGSDLSLLSSLVLTDLPPLKSYSYEGTIERASGEAPILFRDFQLAVQESDLAGNAELALAPLRVTADLSSTQLDALHFLEPAAETPEPEAREKEEPFSIPYDDLDGVEISINANLKSVRVKPNLLLEDVTTNIAVRDKRISMPQFTAETFGGTVTATVDASREKLEISARGKELKSDPITALEGGTEIFQGLFAFSADLKSKGELISEILEHASGELDIRSVDASLNSETLRTVSGNLAEILEPIFGESKRAEVPCILFRFTIDQGIAKSEENVIKLGDVFIFGKGKLDFPENKIGYNFHVNSSKPALASLIPPFRAFGELDSPYFVPSATGTVASAVDTAQGVTQSATGLLSSVANFALGEDAENLEGVQICQRAHEIEKKMLSSQVGTLLE